MLIYSPDASKEATTPRRRRRCIHSQAPQLVFTLPSLPAQVDRLFLHCSSSSSVVLAAATAHYGLNARFQRGRRAQAARNPNEQKPNKAAIERL